MLKIRLMRIGAKQRPFYRVVVVDERAKRTGAYIELLGTYNPLTEPKDIKLKQDRIDYWIKQGAQLSSGYLRMIGKAPQRPPRKPKKEKKVEEPSVVSDQPSDEGKQEQTEKVEEKTEEAPTEEEKSEQPVIATPSEERGKQSSPDENPTQTATDPEAPRNDTNVEEKKE